MAGGWLCSVCQTPNSEASDACANDRCCLLRVQAGVNVGSKRRARVRYRADYADARYAEWHDDDDYQSKMRKVASLSPRVSALARN